MTKFGLLNEFNESSGRIWREIKISLSRTKKPKKWVFVIGCANSGTTLLSSLLGAHPSISTMPVEGQFLTNILPVDLDVGLPRMWTRNEWMFRLNAGSNFINADRIKKEWSMRFNGDTDIFLEHSPPHSARTLWLQEHFPNSYFINIVRNGYAVAEGIRRKAIPYYMPQGWPIEWTASHWRRSCEIVNEDSTKLDNYFELKYEDLCSDPDTHISNIFKFISLRPLDYSVNSLKLRIHERSEKIKNMNSFSIQNLSSTEINKVYSEAETMLDHYKYDANV